jgi:hypothetical protein
VVKHDIRHDLDMDTAKLAARKAVEAYGERFADYDFRSRWVDDTLVELSFAVAGKRLDGNMRVRSDALALSLDVPFVFRVFKNRAIDIIEREARKWIDRARNGELSESA